MSKKKLYLITGAFPYGTGEKTFILPELKALREQFDVTVLTCALDKICRDIKSKAILDADIKVVEINRYGMKNWKYIKYFFLFWTKPECRLEAKNVLKTKKMVLRRIWSSIKYYAVAEHLYCNILEKGIIDKDEDGIFYSYWYNAKVLGMLLHRQDFPRIRIITRAHGFDLYNERVHKTQRQPFKQIMDTKLDKVIFISKNGYDYYIQNYADAEIVDKNKYAVAYLGVTAQHYNADRKKKTPMLLVSCATIKPLKRIDYIIRALAEIETYEIKWVHFGGGYEYETISALATELLGDKKNISYELKGQVENKEILSYYEKEEPDCFILTSSTEGSPVSMQEAMAFGIPVIGTAVGGIPEIIDGNGVLLPANPTICEVADAIQRVCALEQKQYAEMCKISYDIWKEKLNQEENVRKFIEFINS